MIDISEVVMVEILGGLKRGQPDPWPLRECVHDSQRKKVSDLRFGGGHRRTPRNNFC